jgi:hypothetical protein
LFCFRDLLKAVVSSQIKNLQDQLAKSFHLICEYIIILPNKPNEKQSDFYLNVFWSWASTRRSRGNFVGAVT